MNNLTLQTPLGIISIELDQNLRVQKLSLISSNIQEIEYNEQVNKSLEKIKSIVVSYFSGDLVNIEYPVNLDDISEIDRKVLKFVSSIPFGRVITYKFIAERLEISPRRVGLALSRNPAPIIIPCHRIIMSSGQLGGYLLGVNVKKWLIEHERSILYKLQLHRI